MAIPEQLRGSALNIMQHRFNETLDAILEKCDNVGEKLNFQKPCEDGCNICFPDAEESSDEHDDDDPPGYVDPQGPVQYTPTDASATSTDEEDGSDQRDQAYGFHNQNTRVQRAFINIPTLQRKPMVIKNTRQKCKTSSDTL